MTRQLGTKVNNSTMFKTAGCTHKVLSIMAVTLLALTVTSCSSGSTSSAERKPSVRETRWLEACRSEPFTFKCEEAIASNEAKDLMFYSLSNSKIDYEELLTRATGPHNFWCYTEEGRCYTTIHAFNNQSTPYANSPTAVIKDGDGKLNYAVLDGSVSFDGIVEWPLETDHFYDLNPGQESRDLGASQIWRVGFNIKASKMQNLQYLTIGEATDTGAFAPDGPRIPLCKKSNSTPDLIIYEDCRILNEWDYVNGEYQKKKAPVAKATEKEVQPSAATAGEPCDQAGAKSKDNGITYTCIKLGEKLYWDNGVTVPTTKKAASVIGSTGPGGGIVFYDAGSQQSWGRYLEASTKDIAIKGNWCDQWRILIGASGKGMGSGKKNSESILNECGSSAATFAQSFRSGGMSDWFLPSIDELSQIFKQKKFFSRLDCSYYWSSTEDDENNAWQIVFDNGKVIATEPVDKTGGPFCIRPIRSF